MHILYFAIYSKCLYTILCCRITDKDPRVLNDPEIQRIAQSHQRTPAQVTFCNNCKDHINHNFRFKWQFVGWIRIGSTSMVPPKGFGCHPKKHEKRAFGWKSQGMFAHKREFVLYLFRYSIYMYLLYNFSFMYGLWYILQAYKRLGCSLSRGLSAFKFLDIL